MPDAVLLALGVAPVAEVSDDAALFEESLPLLLLAVASPLPPVPAVVPWFVVAVLGVGTAALVSAALGCVVLVRASSSSLSRPHAVSESAKMMAAAADKLFVITLTPVVRTFQ